MTEDVTLSADDARSLARTALMRVGMSEAAAGALARATVDAELAGKPALGLAHLTDYLRGLLDGRIAGRAEPLITSPVPAIMKCVTRPAGHDSVASGSHRSAILPASYSTNISGNSFDTRTVL